MPALPNPYTNKYDASGLLPTLEEARLLALQNIAQQTVADLNTALAAAPLPSSGAGLLKFAGADVLIGDPTVLQRSAICISGGGRDDALDCMVQEAFVAGGSETDTFGEQLFTKIIVYVHPKALYNPDGPTQAAYRELALTRIAGHFRKRVFNSASQFYRINLASREHPDPVTGYDILAKCRIASVRIGTSQKSFGTDEMWPSVDMIHRGIINCIRDDG